MYDFKCFPSPETKETRSIWKPWENHYLWFLLYIFTPSWETKWFNPWILCTAVSSNGWHKCLSQARIIIMDAWAGEARQEPKCLTIPRRKRKHPWPEDELLKHSTQKYALLFLKILLGMQAVRKRNIIWRQTGVLKPKVSTNQKSTNIWGGKSITKSRQTQESGLIPQETE